ncbi:MAG: hypothetical protein GEU81_16120 [Nitriliruptorales bacterium]|nr:hypothetical protein [Nitriliruptorales bacterium]
MSAIETLRAFLVAGAAIAAVVSAFRGLWLAALILTTAVIIHGFLTVHLRRTRNTARASDLSGQV